MDDNVQEIIDKQSCSLKVDESLLSSAGDNEAVLCLNYNGFYGINNINRFLQESNPNPTYEWDVHQYKVDNPVLFLENNRFHPVIYKNMRGKIVGIEKLDVGKPDERIQFDVELNTTIDPSEIRFMPLDVLDGPFDEYSTVRFSVYKTKSTDEVDELITHNIFYTAITRAQKDLKICWTPEVKKKGLERIRPRNIYTDVEILKNYIKPPIEDQFLHF